MGEAAASPGNTATDAELVLAARVGDGQAFSKLVERYQTLVSSIAFALTGNLSHSEEVTQETFIAAWRYLPRLEPPQHFRSWLYGITRNLSHKSRFHERRKIFGQTKRIPAGEEVPSGDPSPLDQIVSREQQRLLWRALGAIPEAYRVPLVLFYREEKSIEKVADMLDLSGDTVRQRLSRGRKMLSEQMMLLAESALESTRLGKRFTATVLAAIAALTADPASAASPTREGPRAVSKKAILLGSALLLGLALFLAGAHLVKGPSPGHNAGRPGLGESHLGGPGSTPPAIPSRGRGAAEAVRSSGADDEADNEPVTLFSFDF